MDRIAKVLARLSAKETRVVKKLLADINSGEVAYLDIKKLKGRNDIFRARKGDLRVIFRQYKNNIFILAIERRSEKTYKRF